MIRTSFLKLFILIVLLSACGDVNEDTVTDEETVTQPGVAIDEGYPAPSEEEVAEGISVPIGSPSESGYPVSPQEGGASESAYPAPGTQMITGDESGYPSLFSTPSSAYPAPSSLIDESKRFTIEEPVEDGQLEISGTGIAGVSIKVISISHAGEQLGFGVVTEDGDFTIGLNRAGDGGELLGLQFADDSTAATLEGVPGTDMPLIGLILAQAVVDR